MLNLGSEMFFEGQDGSFKYEKLLNCIRTAYFSTNGAIFLFTQRNKM